MRAMEDRFRDGRRVRQDHANTTHIVHNQGRKTVLKTSCLVSGNRLAAMKELAENPVEFKPIDRIVGPEKYVIATKGQDPSV